MTTSPSLAERAVDRLSGVVAGPGVSRRGFLGRAAVVASALVVNPLDFVLKPQSAYATVCGAGNECSGGWSAFCCTINDGANTCPPGSFAAGWWKVDDSAFCDGAARYYVDCNRSLSASCRCDCAEGDCDRRKVCCNVFRYGQCNQQIAATTEVVCRIVLCTPPWEWDEACTPTVRTAEETRTHSATCLPGRGASDIAIKYQDLGLAGSVLGRQTRAESDTDDGGRIAVYRHGLIMWSAPTDAHEVHGPLVRRYRELGGHRSDLGYPVSDVEPVEGSRDPAAVSRFEGGAIWLTPRGDVWETTGRIHDRYRGEGGAGGWLGFPISGVEDAEGDRRRVAFASGWSIFADAGRDETRILPSGVDLPGEGWPAGVEVVRWAGTDRYRTAVDVARATFRTGAPVVYLARGDDFADALTSGVPAGLAGGPVLLTSTDALPEVTRRELERLAPTQVVVLGGTAVVGERVVDAVRRSVDAPVLRVAGQTRFVTATALSRRTFAPEEVEEVWVTTGQDFPDALSGAPGAGRAGAPLLLVARDRVPPAVIDELDRLAPGRIVLLGGGRAADRGVERRLERHATEGVLRLSGDDRAATAAAVSREAFPDGASEAVVVTGRTFPDGLAAGPVAITRGAPVLLVDPDAVPAATDAELRRLRPHGIRIVGGTEAVSEDVVDRLSLYPKPDQEG